MDNNTKQPIDLDGVPLPLPEFLAELVEWTKEKYGDQEFVFASSDEATTENRPRLVINYDPPEITE